MADMFEFRLEIPFTSFDGSETTRMRLSQAINEAVTESHLQEVAETPQIRPTFSQGTPTKEEVSIALAVLAFVIQQGPTVWPHIKAFLEAVWMRLQSIPHHKQSILRIELPDGKEIVVKGFGSKDSLQYTSRELEVYFGPRR